MKEKKPTTPKAKVTEVNIKSLNVYERLLKVQTEAKTVIQTGFNDYSKYAYTKEVDYQGELKPLLGSNRLAIVSRGIKDVKELGQTVVVTMSYSLVNVDSPEDKIDMDFIGAGRDTEVKGETVGEKAYAKAMTMCNKYMLAKVFQLESEDNDDSKTPDAKAKGKKGEEPKGDTAADYARALKMIGASNNDTGLEEWVVKILDKSQHYTASQKEGLKKAVKDRVAILRGEDPNVDIAE